VDPVSQILADRERSQPRLLPWVAMAAVLHGLVVAVAFLYGRNAAARPAHLPVVSVKLIRPERPPGGPPASSRPRPTAAATAPKPTAAATAVPKPQPTAPPRKRASEKAMAAPEAAASPIPTEVAEPEVSGSGSGPGGGLSLGADVGGEIAGVPADFHFTYYIERMLALIESRWYKPPVAQGTRTRVRFRIQRDGRLDAIAIEESSGHPSFDRAALRALYASNPLPPLPPAYTQPSLTVHLSFAE
jgi:protein TonB